MTLHLALMALVTGIGFATAQAAEPMPTCTSIAKLPEQISSRVALIAIDQTTISDANLMNKFTQLATGLAQPSTKISSYTFSAFSQGRYLSEQFNGALEKPLDDKVRYETPKKVLTVFDRCMSQKTPAFKKKLSQQIQQDMEQASDNLARSDIVLSLVELSKVIRNEPAASKYVLIFSDMLEHSSISSFYAKSAVRKVDVAKEIAKIEQADMFGDFGGAKVYVMGAGLLSTQGKSNGAYRDPKTLQALKQFWSEWFTRSNAELVEFGMPEILGNIN